PRPASSRWIARRRPDRSARLERRRLVLVADQRVQPVSHRDAVRGTESDPAGGSWPWRYPRQLGPSGGEGAVTDQMAAAAAHPSRVTPVIGHGSDCKRDLWICWWIFPAFYTLFGVIFVPLT